MSDIDRICAERMKPIIKRMEAMAKEMDRLRRGAAVDAEVERARDEADLEASRRLAGIERRLAEAERKAARYRERAYRAERKLNLILSGDLDPFDLMTPEQIEAFHRAVQQKWANSA
jgi:hypothetical protein